MSLIDFAQVCPRGQTPSSVQDSCARCATIAWNKGQSETICPPSDHARTHDNSCISVGAESLANVVHVGALGPPKVLLHSCCAPSARTRQLVPAITMEKSTTERLSRPPQRAFNQAHIASSRVCIHRLLGCSGSAGFELRLHTRMHEHGTSYFGWIPQSQSIRCHSLHPASQSPCEPTRDLLCSNLSFRQSHLPAPIRSTVLPE